MILSSYLVGEKVVEYLSLYKKYVITNESEARKLYEERFHSESSFHLPLFIGKNEAFFYGHPEIFIKVAKIHKLDKEIRYMVEELPPVALHHFVKRCMIDEIQFTNDIEGVVSTRKEISEILDEFKKSKPNAKLDGIVNSYKELYKSKNIKLETSLDIRKIYDTLLYSEINEENPSNLPDGKVFRKNAVEVDNIEGKMIHSGIYPEDKIITYIDESLKFLKNKDLDSLINISIFHYMFGYIHPFYDGNGRTSRFITSYLLSKELSPIMAFSISSTIKEKLSVYYKAFKETNDPRNFGDMGTFVNYFLSLIITAEEKVIKFTKEKLEQIDGIVKSLKNKGKDYKFREFEFIFVLIQSTLFSEKGVSMMELVNNTDFDRKTIKNFIDNNKDIILVDTKGREYLYSLNLSKFVDGVDACRLFQLS